MTRIRKSKRRWCVRVSDGSQKLLPFYVHFRLVTFTIFTSPCLPRRAAGARRSSPPTFYTYSKLILEALPHLPYSRPSAAARGGGARSSRELLHRYWLHRLCRKALLAYPTTRCIKEILLALGLRLGGGNHFRQRPKAYCSLLAGLQPAALTFPG